MSKKSPPGSGAQDVRITMSNRPVYKGSRHPDQFVYVNNAYVGSVNDVDNVHRTLEPSTSVIREQYCVCSRWPFGQRVLAAAVGLLLGTVIGLAVTLALRGKNDNIIGLFKYSAPD